jgi:hypothetical protein
MDGPERTDEAYLAEFHHRRDVLRRFLRATGREGQVHPCPGCGLATLGDRTAVETCPICGWEDDGREDPAPGDVDDGPLSLTACRLQFASDLERLAGGTEELEALARKLRAHLANHELEAERLGTRALTGHYEDDDALTDWLELTGKIRRALATFD